jgi:hypothetical protein
LLALVLITPKAASPQPQAFARSGADHAKGGFGLRGGFAAAATVQFRRNW